MHKHKKSLGQNFLIDDIIIDNIIKTINPEKHDNILEIGVGTGALTKPLLAKLNKLNIVEIDNDLIDFWQNKKIANLVINHADILKFNLLSIGDNIRIVGNLPYNISSPILFKMLDNINIIKDMTFMLQYEVANRIVAKPNNKIYGRLSVMMQTFFDVELLFKVPASAFRPMPKVQSAIIKLIPKKTNKDQPKNIEDFSFIVKKCFTMKRKTLKNNLKNILSTENTNIDLSKRAENLTISEFITLSSDYSKKT